MEPTTSLVTTLAAKSCNAAVEVAKEEATGFLNQLLGLYASTIGESFALRRRERMFNNIVEVLQRAKKKLKEAGLTPKEVPLKIIHPLLEAASLEEETDIQEVWANLLVGVATSRSPFHAAFTEASFGEFVGNWRAQRGGLVRKKRLSLRQVASKER